MQYVTGDRSVGLPMDHGLDNRSSFPGKSKSICLLHSVEKCPGTQPPI
jgi:hypothetical protein